MAILKDHELAFICENYNITLTAAELARLFHIHASDVRAAANQMGITRPYVPIRTLYSPYLPEVARSIDKRGFPVVALTLRQWAKLMRGATDAKEEVQD